MMRNENAQLYTVEGIASAVLLVMVVIFVVRAAPMTPNTASSTNRYLEAQLETEGQDLLIILDYVPEGSPRSQLKQTVMDWTGVRFEGQSTVYPASVNNTANVFKEVLADAGIAYNLEVSFSTPTGISTREMFWNGRPSDNAVTVSRKLVLHDEDMLSNPELSAIIQDMDSSSTRFYNTIDVRLTLWTM